MTDLNDDELQVLQGARRALSPNLQDAARVLAATELAIAALPPVPPQATAAGGAQTFSAGLGAKLTAALVIGAVSGAIGYYAGYRDARSDAARALTPPTAAAKHTTLPAPTIVTTHAPTERAVPEVVAPPAEEPAIEPTVTNLRGPVAAVERARSRTITRMEADAGVAALGPQSLQVELDALRRVERALRDHEPKRALVLLAELDRNVPDGKLDEERSAAFVMARCAVKLGTPGGLVAEFTGKYPHSAYLARVQASCKASP